MIISNLLIRKGRRMFAQMFAGTKAQMMEFGNALVSGIAHARHVGWQAGQQAGLTQERNVRTASFHTGTDLNQPACVFVNRHLGFDGMAALLATVPSSAFSGTFWTLNRLFKGIDPHRQFGNVFDQFRQLAATFTPRIRQAHTGLSSLFQDWQYMPDVASDCRLAHPKQKAQYIMGWIYTQPDHRQQDLIAGRQVRLVT